MAGALCWSVGELLVVVSVGAQVLQENGQCRQENGPTVVHGEVRQQLLVRCPGLGFWRRGNCVG